MKIELPKHSLQGLGVLSRDTGGASDKWFFHEPTARVVSVIYDKPDDGNEKDMRSHKEKMAELVSAVVVDENGNHPFDDESPLELSNRGFNQLSGFVMEKLKSEYDGSGEPDAKKTSF